MAKVFNSGRGTAAIRDEDTHVIVISPESLDNGGGIGTVARLICDLDQCRYHNFKFHEINARGSQWKKFWLSNYIIALIKVSTLCIRHRSRILHINVSERGSFYRKMGFVYLGRMFSAPTILHHHGAELIPSYSKGSRLLRWVMTYAIRLATINIVLGTIWRNFLLNEFRIDEKNVQLVYNASVDYGYVSRNFEHSSESPFSIILVANLIQRKGISEALKSVSILYKAGLSIRLTLLGGGDINRYKQESIDFGIDHLCSFEGWVPKQEVINHMREAQAFILPSFNEGLPMSILEALSMGLPVIASEVGSIPEVLTCEKDCLLVKPGDASDLANALKRLVLDTEFCKRISENGRRLYETKFARETFSENVIAIYRILVGDASASER